MKTDWLKEFGNFGPTVRGDELKGWTRDEEGTYKIYLSSKDCEEIAEQFLKAAEQFLKAAEQLKSPIYT